MENADCEGMYSKLVDNSSPYEDESCGVDQYTPDVEHKVFVTPTKWGMRRSGQGPYRVATACLSAFCLILLMVLVAISIHNKSSPPGEGMAQDPTSHVSMHRAGMNVSDLTAALQKLEQEKTELLASLSKAHKAHQNLTSLTSAYEILEKERSDLLEERKKLLARVMEMEATDAPVTDAPVTCPRNWHLFNGSCYLVPSTRKSWHESQLFCNGKGGHLAIIHTPEEQTFIWNLLPRGYWNSFWFGMSDQHAEDEWRWVDGTTVTTFFWEEGEPNNHNDNEDCGYIVKTNVMTRVAVRSWYDAPCYMGLPCVCEMEM